MSNNDFLQQIKINDDDDLKYVQAIQAITTKCPHASCRGNFQRFSHDYVNKVGKHEVLASVYRKLGTIAMR